MIELTESVGNPSLISALVSHAMNDRKVDALLSAHNLMRLPIRDMALQEEQLL